ncbi:hypothetical protein [Lentzea sp. NPDC059081]|uniref:DUF2017 family protein n=1 Tax=Lentzea sp. NPDC059081 TaxID=3346719 RepID=UPI003681719C
MICWDSLGDGVVGYFDEFEIELMRGYADSLLRLLDHRTTSYSSFRDEKGREFRLPEEAATDVRLTAILRTEIGQLEPGWFFPFLEARCLAEVADEVRGVLSVLPSTGGLVCLTQAQASSWVAVLRRYLAVIDAVKDETGCHKGTPVQPTVLWFTAVADGLDAQLHLASRHSSPYGTARSTG